MSLQAGSPDKKRKKNNGGFTTIEQIVVIILLMILAGGLIVGIMKWVEWTNFKRQNEYAKTLFVAAQNQLTEYSESGTLSELQGAVLKSREIEEKQNGELSAGGEILKGKDGQPYNINKVWPQSSNKDNKSDYRGAIYSVIGTPADYKAYKNGAEGTADDIRAMYDLLSPYVYDISIFSEGVICLEFAPEDGQVFAVLYSDIAEGFEYNSANTEKKGTVDISDRETGYRKDRMVGYYGVDMLSKATSPKAGKPSIGGVRLNNEDTLNLSFKLTKLDKAIKQLTYEVDIYDQNKDLKKARKVLSLTLNGKELGDKKDSGNLMPCKVVRYNYDSEGKSTEQELGKDNAYKVNAWIEDKNTIRIVLDGADRKASSYLYKEAYDALMDTKKSSNGKIMPQNLKDLIATGSFRRFGVLTEDIYCTVRGSGNYYKPTAKKKTNTENTYFGSEKSITPDGPGADGTASTTYTLKNARHLYNIRYLEDYGDELSLKNESGGKKSAAKKEKIIYQLAKNIDWRKFVRGGSLYEDGKAITVKDGEEYPAFPSVKQLRADSSMEGAKNKFHTISGLLLSRADNEKMEVYSDMRKEEGLPTGLFVINNGTMKDFKLDWITVSGKEKTGAFCGVNKGELTGLETLNSGSKEEKSTVTGTENVGGIFGYDAGEGTVRISGLTNRAKVSGAKDAGGIVGMISGNVKEQDREERKVTITDCKNYGAIAAAANDSTNLGGITGSAWSVGDGHAVIENCTSSPQYSEEEIRDILASPDEYFKGTNVGGIVGYTDKAVVRNCNTSKESRDKEGFVVGGAYVGGIVGLSDNDSQIGDKDDDQKTRVNGAHVLANEYAGGIVGKIAGGTIEGWTNTGVAAARKQYAGGITGWNGGPESGPGNGRIIDCSSSVENNKTARLLTGNLKLFGDYAGGIAGYNNGIISNTTGNTISVVSYVLGRNYLGGIVGYNDKDGDVEGYAVAGGYVKGSGSYVGGFAGVNISKVLINGRLLSSNPNEVSGAYCVGGTIGGNVVMLTGKILARFETDNFLGTLEAEAFAGGYMGYNRVVSGKNSQEDIKNAIESTAYALNEAKNHAELSAAAAAIKGLDSLDVEGAGVLAISGSESSTSSTRQSKFGGITAKIYVGGVIGYHSDAGYTTRNSLAVQYVKNMTPVKATASIENENEQPGRKTYEGKPFRYSYAGGITGKVTPDMQLNYCSNEDVGDVSAEGTYLGGLCEINEGVIQECSASSIGNSGHDYVGSIAGLNKSGAEISYCDITGKTVTGKNYVGGMVSENFGKISEAYIKFLTIRSYGTYENGASGGIAACNYEDGRITIGSPVDVRVNADGNNAGGITGRNEGTLNKASYVTGNIVTAASSITGGRNVGGIVGNNSSVKEKISGFTGSASVTARNGSAGGIAGVSAADIDNCKNEGSVLAQRSGNSGGIVGNNTGRIASCTNTGSVSAQNGICGGITGENEGQIDNCTVSGKNEIHLLTFEGKEKAGGICGSNSGSIENTSVSNITVRNLSDSKNSVLGGITGDNTGRVAGCSVGRKALPVNIRSNAAQVSAGGVSGNNAGTITGGTGKEVFADLSFVSTNSAYYGNLGGIAGANTGMIEGYTYSGTVTGTGNNPDKKPEYNPNTDYETNGAVIYGYGGIAGVNGNPGKKTDAVIRNCKVNQAGITALGDANNIANAGGIAGVNGPGASVSGIAYGTAQADRIYSVKNDGGYETVKTASASVYVGSGADKGKDSYTHAGGAAGLNSGSISDIEDKEGTSLIVEGYRGHIGGIVGYNRRTGRIHDVSTGKNWVVFAPESATDNGCGGIAGYSASEEGMTGCVNRSFVQKTVTGSNGVGGIIGRLEYASGSSYTISGCENYGRVFGADRAGGIIGVWKYYGGTIADCKNYARVSAVGVNSNNERIGISGGIAGQLYRLNLTAARFIRCENHGTIKGANSGGIAGGSREGAAVQVERCANTGLIQGKDGSEGGILGKMAITSESDSYIKDTNNYGYHYQAEGQSGMSGIKAEGTTGITLSGCFGAADTIPPVTSGAGDNNYYISYGNTEEGSYNGTKAFVTNDGSRKFRLIGVIGDKRQTIGLPGFSANPKDMAGRGNNSTSDESLKVMGDANDNIRYRTFAADNPYFVAGASEGVAEHDLGMPRITAVASADNGNYRAEWTPVDKATFYNYVIEYRDGAGNLLDTRNGTAYDTKLIFPVTAIDGAAVKSVTVKITAGADTTDKKGKVVQVISKQTAEATANVGDILPIPQYHLELVRRQENGKETFTYKAYLDNRADYEAFLRKRGISEEHLQGELEKIQIHIGIGSSEKYLFNAADENSGTAYYGGSDVNQIFYAYAGWAAGNEIISSPKILRESMSFTSGTYMNPDGTKTEDIASVYILPKEKNQIGFQGTTANTLAYRLTMNHQKSRILYMRSELMAVDVSEDGLKVPVAVSTSQLRVSDTSGSAIPTYLNGLPANLLDSSVYSGLMVRSYPSMMNNNVVYTGHSVDLTALKAEGEEGTGISKDRLKELYVTDEHQVTDKNPEGKLKKLIEEEGGKKHLASGFVIELAGDGTYTLYYNALLEYNSEVLHYDYSGGKNESTQQTQVFYYWLEKYLAGKKYQNKPVIHVNRQESGEDGSPDEDTMVITWDLKDSDGDNYTPGAVYDYSVTGYTKDGEAVRITEGIYTTEEGKENRLADLDTRNWDYRKVTISITRRGEEKNGMTEVFPMGSIKELELKLKFTQITKPDVFLHKITVGDGVEMVQKNSLVYDVTWPNIPEEEQGHMNAYEILVAYSDKNNGKDYSDEGLFRTDLDNAKKLYEKKDAAPVEDSGGNKITYTWEEQISEEMSVAKTMVLSWTEGSGTSGWNIKKSLTEVFHILWTDDNISLEGKEQSVTRTLDLNDFGRGDQIEISVRALAKPDTENYRNEYRDGASGIVREMELPSRLDVPDVTKMKISPSWAPHKDDITEGDKTYMTLEELKEGITLSIDAPQEAGILQGTYELAMAVYDTKPEGADADKEKAVNPGDGDGAQEGYWNTGALATLITKGEPASMEGNLKDADYVQKFADSAYAGKWLKIAVRSISESNISSLWSDEDDIEENGGTVNYKWLRIPRVQLETPELTQDTKSMFYEDTGGWKGDPSQEAAGAAQFTAVQSGLAFELTDNAQGYRIQLIRSGREFSDIDPDSKEKYSIFDTDFIYVEKADEERYEKNRYHVFYASSAPEFDEEPYRRNEALGTPVSLMGELSVYLGTIGASEGAPSFLQLPYSKETATGPADNALKITAASYIRISSQENGKQKITLVLPDVEEINGYSPADYLYTSQVSAQAVIPGENPDGYSDRYEDSQVFNWYRNKDGSTGSVVMEDYQKAPASLTMEYPQASGLLETAYTIGAQADQRLVFQVKITDAAAGAVLREEYVGAYGAGTIGSTIHSAALLPMKDYGGYEGASVSVRAAAVIPGSFGDGTPAGAKGGLSRWTNWISLGPLPAVNTVKAAEQEPAADIPAIWQMIQEEPSAKDEETAEDEDAGTTGNEISGNETSGETGGHSEASGETGDGADIQSGNKNRLQESEK